MRKEDAGMLKLEKEPVKVKLLREWLEWLDRYLLDPDSSLYSEERQPVKSRV